MEPARLAIPGLAFQPSESSRSASSAHGDIDLMGAPEPSTDNRIQHSVVAPRAHGHDQCGGPGHVWNDFDQVVPLNSFVTARPLPVTIFSGHFETALCRNMVVRSVNFRSVGPAGLALSHMAGALGGQRPSHRLLSRNCNWHQQSCPNANDVSRVTWRRPPSPFDPGESRNTPSMSRLVRISAALLLAWPCSRALTAWGVISVHSEYQTIGIMCVYIFGLFVVY